MGDIDFKTIKRLASSTGVGVTEAKKALVANKGDFEKAYDDMRAKGLAKAEKRAERVAKAGVIDAYTHDGRIGALVELNCETDFVARTEEFRQFAHDLCLQVAASSPRYIDRKQVPESELEKERKLEKAALMAEGKPAQVIETIIKGKLEKYFQSICLIDQPFIKDPQKSVGTLLGELSAKVGEKIEIARFKRFELGINE